MSERFFATSRKPLNRNDAGSSGSSKRAKPMGKDFKNKVLAVLPMPRDFLPSRFVRKISMVVAWCGLLMFVMMLVAVTNRSWLHIDNTRDVVLDRGGIVEISTYGDCSLTRCSFRRNSSESIVIEHVSGDPQELTGVAQLTTLGQGVIWVHVIQLLLVPLFMALFFLHGWSRIASQARSFFLALCAALTEWVLGTIAYALYLGAKPTDGEDADGAYLGAGFWICFVNSLLWLAAVIAVLFDKPADLSCSGGGSGGGKEAYSFVDLSRTTSTPTSSVSAVICLLGTQQAVHTSRDRGRKRHAHRVSCQRLTDVRAGMYGSTNINTSTTMKQRRDMVSFV